MNPPYHHHQYRKGKPSRLFFFPCVKTPAITCVMDERAHHHLIIPQQDKYGGGGHLKTNAILLVARAWSGVFIMV